MGLRRVGTLVVAAGILVLLGQQCSRVNLTPYYVNAFSLSQSPYNLNAPSQFPVIRKYIILVDMSKSMIAGPCPQDIDAGLLYQTNTPYLPYDPMKTYNCQYLVAGCSTPVGNMNDHRADGSSCQVNPNLPIEQASIIDPQNPGAVSNPPNIPGSITNTEDLSVPNFFQTTYGVDWEGDRFKIVQTWIQQIVSSSTPETLKNTEILIYPFTGGEYQQLLLAGYPVGMQFYHANDSKLTEAVTYLGDPQTGQQALNLGLAESNLAYRYENQTMGTSSLGAYSVQFDQNETCPPTARSFSSFTTSSITTCTPSTTDV